MGNRHDLLLSEADGGLGLVRDIKNVPVCVREGKGLRSEVRGFRNFEP
jgi:hypothetical protein